jgi:hypothetical protein
MVAAHDSEVGWGGDQWGGVQRRGEGARPDGRCGRWRREIGFRVRKHWEELKRGGHVVVVEGEGEDAGGKRRCGRREEGRAAGGDGVERGTAWVCLEVRRG